ncbi:MAG: hypothetical protein HC838_05075 [Spirulinaceae cyanobacterium RM2_2_10]|nr:hypothetical protein [Spirulinaceae cyanobacterium RM2_2_10]
MLSRLLIKNPYFIKLDLLVTLSLSSATAGDVADETTIELVLTGEGMSPGKIRSQELAEIIESVEDMIAPMVVHAHPKLTEDRVVVGLKVTIQVIGLH